MRVEAGRLHPAERALWDREHPHPVDGRHDPGPGRDARHGHRRRRGRLPPVEPQHRPGAVPTGVDAVRAAPGPGDDMVDALDRDVLAQHHAEQRQFRPAEALAGAGGGADRAVVLDQQPAVAVAPPFGHVALAVAQGGQRGDPVFQPVGTGDGGLVGAVAAGPRDRRSTGPSRRPPKTRITLSIRSTVRAAWLSGKRPCPASVSAHQRLGRPTFSRRSSKPTSPRSPAWRDAGGCPGALMSRAAPSACAVHRPRVFSRNRMRSGLPSLMADGVAERLPQCNKTIS